MATLESILSGIEQSGDDKKLEALSQAAEAAERYEDMVKIMEKLVKNKLEKTEELSPDQRNLLSVAYKNVVGAKRSSWRVLNEDNQFDEAAVDLAANYKKRVEKELEEICNQILDVLQKLSAQNETRMNDENDAEKKKLVEECQVFYLKMIGDYYRYLTEALPCDKYKNNCNKYYADAMKIAEESLDATHPTRLGLALNYSVCHYEILNQPKEACTLAKKAFDEAIEKLDSLSDVSYRDSTLIMQLLRDNLTIWNQADEAQDADE
jgi:mRNA-degrading endonuclease RelE of RelBE toxin-antitoxin system